MALCVICWHYMTLYAYLISYCGCRIVASSPRITVARCLERIYATNLYGEEQAPRAVSGNGVSPWQPWAHGIPQKHQRLLTYVMTWKFEWGDWLAVFGWTERAREREKKKNDLINVGRLAGFLSQRRTCSTFVVFFYQKQYKLRRLGPARCREVSVAFRFLLRQGLSLTNGNTPEAPKRMKSMDQKARNRTACACVERERKIVYIDRDVHIYICVC
jgi:hypothetical protein